MALQGVGTIKATLDLNSAPFQKALRQAAMQTQNLQKKTAAASAGGLKQMGGAISGMVGKISIWGASLIGAYKAVEGVAKLGNSYVIAQRKLKNLTKETGDYEAVAKKVNEISNTYGVSTEDTATNIQKMLVRTRELGVSNKEGIDIYESLVQRSRDYSDQTHELNNFMLQIGQAAGQVNVTWDNLGAAQENSAGLFKDLTKAMGKTTAELRAMGKAGKLSGKLVVEGLRKMAAETDKSVKPVRTVEAAWQTLKNQIGKSMGEMFQSSGGLTTLANTIDAISSGIAKYLPMVLEEISNTFKQIVKDLGGKEVILKILKEDMGSYITYN